MQTLMQVITAQVEFNLLDAEAQYGIELDGLVTEPSELSTGTASNDLYMVLGHSGGSLEGRLEFNADLFTPVTAQRLVDDWQVWPSTSWPKLRSSFVKQFWLWGRFEKVCKLLKHSMRTCIVVTAQQLVNDRALWSVIM